MSYTPDIERTHAAGMGGVQKLYFFPNGYGASVVKGPYTHGGKEGLWELGVLEGRDDDNFNLTYETSITSDVEGYLTDEDVEKLLAQIEALPVK